MTDEIRLWAVDTSSKEVQPVSPTDQVEEEQLLEEVLVGNPEMLMPRLTLVGRQTPTDGGHLDLLGVDENGTLVVFELKRGKLTRAAVAQIIDYCSYLESLSEDDLTAHIAERSGKSGIDQIDNFDDWYRERTGGRDVAQARPARMVLVGLGADPVTQRMVGFLADSGVDISLLTFHGYEYGRDTLLARQIEGGEARDVGSTPRRESQAERRRRHAELASELDIEALWLDAIDALGVASDGYASMSGITYYVRPIVLGDVKPSGSHSIVIDKDVRKIRVTFYPAAVHLCMGEFQKLNEKIKFQTRKPPNAPSTDKVREEWYRLMDMQEWEMHKEAFVALAKTVMDAWEQERKKNPAQRTTALADG